MFANLLIIFAASLVVIALFQRLRLPPVLGYLCVGLMIGPSAFNWVNESEDLPDLAELGVVFLLFSLGLEFSLTKMLALRRVVFGLGSLQVLGTAILLGGLLMLLGMSTTPALLLGAGLSLSSTAIVSKELSSLGEIFSSHGQNAIAVLLFQDVVAVLLLTMVPVFAGSSDQAWYWALPLTLGKTVVLFVGLLLVSRWILPRLFHEVAAARSAELFVLLALVIVLLTAWLTHLLGLSPALGAFLAGMLLGESHYRHQIEADIRPFRDILLGVFFVSIGMLIDLQLFASHGLLILGLTLGLLLLKGSVVALLVKWRGSDGETAWRSGLALAQGGEFCFALMAQMQQNKLMPADFGGLLLAATFCSMLLTPLLLRAAPRIAIYLHRKPNEEAKLEEISALNADLHQHVVICGYGRVGQSIGRALRNAQQPYIALDTDPVRVQEAAVDETCCALWRLAPRRTAGRGRAGARQAAGDRRGSDRHRFTDPQGSAATQCVRADSGAHARRQPTGRVEGFRRQRSGAGTAGVEPDARFPRADHAGATRPSGAGARRPDPARPLSPVARYLSRRRR